MGLIKKPVTPVPPAEPKLPESSGTEGAIARLNKKEPTPAVAPSTVGKGKSYAEIDADKNVRILRQGVYQHALVSPALAGLPFKDVDGYLAIVKDAAEKVIKMIEE